jgi:hypothetical protein
MTSRDNQPHIRWRIYPEHMRAPSSCCPDGKNNLKRATSLCAAPLVRRFLDELRPNRIIAPLVGNQSPHY